jgi:hypothetical protein
MSGRWEFDSQFSARHALSLSTVCMSLLSAGDPAKQVHYSRIVSHYNVIIYSLTSSFCPIPFPPLAPSLLSLSDRH